MIAAGTRPDTGAERQMPLGIRPTRVEHVRFGEDRRVAVGRRDIHDHGCPGGDDRRADRGGCHTHAPDGPHRRIETQCLRDQCFGGRAVRRLRGSRPVPCRSARPSRHRPGPAARCGPRCLRRAYRRTPRRALRPRRRRPARRRCPAGSRERPRQHRRPLRCSTRGAVARTMTGIRPAIASGEAPAANAARLATAACSRSAAGSIASSSVAARARRRPWVGTAGEPRHRRPQPSHVDAAVSCLVRRRRRNRRHLERRVVQRRHGVGITGDVPRRGHAATVGPGQFGRGRTVPAGGPPARTIGGETGKPHPAAGRVWSAGERVARTIGERREDRHGGEAR